MEAINISSKAAFKDFLSSYGWHKTAMFNDIMEDGEGNSIDLTNIHKGWFIYRYGEYITAALSFPDSHFMIGEYDPATFEEYATVREGAIKIKIRRP